MSDIENLKEDIKNNLETNFIDHSASVKKEMGLLNILLSNFVDDQYTYDEYCGCRMKFELEGCDLVNIDLEVEKQMSSQEREIIRARAVRKHMANKEETIYEELLKEEWIKWQVEKIANIDWEIFYPIFRHASIHLIMNKVKGEAWDSNEDFFVDICEAKSKKLATLIAENNKETHEEQLRASNM